MIARLGRWTFQHRRTTLIAWLVALVGFGALGNVIVGPSFSSFVAIAARTLAAPAASTPAAASDSPERPQRTSVDETAAAVGASTAGIVFACAT